MRELAGELERMFYQSCDRWREAILVGREGAIRYSPGCLGVALCLRSPRSKWYFEVRQWPTIHSRCILTVCARCPTSIHPAGARYALLQPRLLDVRYPRSRALSLAGDAPAALPSPKLRGLPFLAHQQNTVIDITGALLWRRRCLLQRIHDCFSNFLFNHSAGCRARDSIRQGSVACRCSCLHRLHSRTRCWTRNRPLRPKPSPRQLRKLFLSIQAWPEFSLWPGAR